MRAEYTTTAAMPRTRLPTSGYARIAQAEEEEEEEVYDEDPFRDTPTLSSSAPGYASIQPGRRERVQYPEVSTLPQRPRRRRANSGVDIKAINQRLERWAEEIKDRFKIRRVKGKSAEDEHLEIYSSVFQAPDWIRPATKAVLEDEYDDSTARLSKLEFDDHVESVRTAIELGMHPTLIMQGSSGSYFARNTGGKVLGVFKPKDEEPYANKNPKWTKWIHRNLLPFAFGRACLIPNLSYVSEAAAYLLDVQLRTNIVPYTEVVSLSSRSFHYDFWERRAFHKNRKPFPEKPGSFQIFLKGFKGATEFFKEHPWPDQQRGGFRDGAQRRKRKRWDDSCRPGSVSAVDEDSQDEGQTGVAGREQSRRAEFWSAELQQSFREQLEKLVILDYIMRNTDRGTDNWMIRIDREKQEASIVVEPPRGEENDQADPAANGYDRRNEHMTNAPSSPAERVLPRLGAIDNSLSWPWKHPDAWRSYPFGWLFLPVSLIGQPFSEKTKKHFLPLLTSKEWWRDTQVKLRSCFELDADFQEKMYARQIAVMKGQAWNVVETLKTSDHGPLELARRSRVLVWDDVVSIPIASPLATPSRERRSTTATQTASRPKEIAEEEEMDISAAHDSVLPARLLDVSPPLQAQQNLFNTSRQNSSQDVLEASRALSPPITTKDKEVPEDSPAAMSLRSTRPGNYRSRTGGARSSYDGPRATYVAPREHRRRFSLNLRTNLGGGLDEDEAGDLGYAVANDQEGRSRKVIVERLEMVKGRPPVFSWC